MMVAIDAITKAGEKTLVRIGKGEYWEAAGLAGAELIGASLKTAKELDGWLGKTLDLAEKAGKPELGGEKASVLGWLGRREWVFAKTAETKETEKWMTRIRGVVTDEMREEFKKLPIALKKARENWDKLTPIQKKTVEQQEQYLKMLKRRIEIDKESHKISIEASKQLKETAVGQAKIMAARVKQYMRGAETAGVGAEAALQEYAKRLTDPQEIKTFQRLLEHRVIRLKALTRSQYAELQETFEKGGKERILAKLKDPVAPGKGLEGALQQVLTMAYRAPVQPVPTKVTQGLQAQNQPVVNAMVTTKPGVAGGTGVVRPDATGKVTMPVNIPKMEVVFDMGSWSVMAKKWQQDMEPKKGR